MGGSLDPEAIDRRPVPGDAEAGLVGGYRAARLDAHALDSQAIELRDVLDPAAVRHRRHQADVQLHQEVRADRDVECLCEMRGLEPGSDSADPGDVDLHDAAGVALQV